MFQTLQVRCRDLCDLGLEDGKASQVTVDLGKSIWRDAHTLWRA